MFWEVIWVTPGISAKYFSSGCATVAAITSGEAPGSVALTTIVGKSTSGIAETGSRK